MMSSRDEIEGALDGLSLSRDCLETEAGGWALVVPGLGAKVLAAGVDRESLFWVNPELAKDAWCAGGQRTWLAPELGALGFFGTATENWTVPAELDPGRYRRIEEPGSRNSYRCDLDIRRRDGRSFALGITRSIRLASVSAGSGLPGLKIRVDNRLINTMDRTLEQEAGLWSIIQVPAQTTGTFLIPLKQTKQTDAAAPPPYRLYFGDLPHDWVTCSPTLLTVKGRAGRWFKIGVSPQLAAGTVGFLCPSRADDAHLLVILRCDLEPRGRYLDKAPAQEVENGDVLQCYNSPDAARLDFCEVEAHAPAVRLQPGEAQSAGVEVTLFKDRFETLCAIAGDLMQRTIDSGRLFSTP